jgi:CHAT domain-containing protein/tetratricopeptide (TPR) repeat protein
MWPFRRKRHRKSDLVSAPQNLQVSDPPAPIAPPLDGVLPAPNPASGPTTDDALDLTIEALAQAIRDPLALSDVIRVHAAALVTAAALDRAHVALGVARATADSDREARAADVAQLIAQFQGMTPDELQEVERRIRQTSAQELTASLALQAWADAATQEEKERVFDARHDILVSDTTIDVLRSTIDEMRAAGRDDTARDMESRLELLDLIAGYERGTGERVGMDGPPDYTEELGAILERLETLTLPADAPELITTLERAMNLLPRSVQPDVRAGLQLMLGEALRQNGRGDRKAQLERAITCYDSALLEFRPTVNPTEWISAQLGKGLALTALAAGPAVTKEAREDDRKAGRATLGSAVDCFDAALVAQPRDADPAQWAQIQLAKGAALGALAALMLDDDRRRETTIRDAIACDDAALALLDRDLARAEWSAGQAAKASALFLLALMEEGEARIATLRAVLASCDAAAPVMDPTTQLAELTQLRVLRKAAAMGVPDAPPPAALAGSAESSVAAVEALSGLFTTLQQAASGGEAAQVDSAELFSALQATASAYATALEGEDGAASAESQAATLGMITFPQWLAATETSWDASRAFLEAHPELLTDAGIAVADQTIAFGRLTGDEEMVRVVARHRDLMLAARRDGIAAAYTAAQPETVEQAAYGGGHSASGNTPVEIGLASIQETALTWIALDDPALSRAYLQGHPELLSDEADGALRMMQGLQLFVRVMGTGSNQEQDGATGAGSNDEDGPTSDEMDAKIVRAQELLAVARRDGIDAAYLQVFGKVEFGDDSTPDALSALDQVAPVAQLENLKRLTHPEDMPERIRLIERALATLPGRKDTSADRPFADGDQDELWTALQVELGQALMQNPLGDRRQQLERAVACFDAALSATTPATDIESIAARLGNKGLALRMLGEISAGEERTHALHASRACFDELLGYGAATLGDATWAGTQANKAATLLALARAVSLEERAPALREAIACCDAGLRVLSRENDPLQWAQSLGNKAIALQDLSWTLNGGARADALREAVQSLDAILLVFTRSVDPLQWGMTQINKGGALLRLAEVSGSVERVALLRQAVSCFDEALSEQQRAVSPYYWAMAQDNKGHTLADLAVLSPREERLDTLRQAITCFDAALREYTPDAAPDQWTMTQNHKGVALIAVARALNGTEREQALREAIGCFDDMLRADSAIAPMQQAEAEANKGFALTILVSVLQPSDQSQASDILREAIHCYDAALTTFTRDAAPAAWASVMTKKGSASFMYAGLEVESTGGESATEADLGALRDAITCFDAALGVLTFDTTPTDWAMTQQNKGLALRHLARLLSGDAQAEVTWQAATCFDEALRVFTREVAPAEHRQIAQLAGEMLFENGDWVAASERLAMALDALDDLYTLSFTRLGQENELTQGAELAADLAYALARTGADDASLKAAAVLERGRARATGAALRRRQEQLRAAAALDPALLSAFQRAADRVAALTLTSGAQFGESVSDLVSKSAAMTAARGLMAGYDEAKTARAEYDACLTQIRQIMPDFLAPSETLPVAVNALADDEQLAYVASTRAGTIVVTIAASAGGPRAQTMYDEELSLSTVNLFAHAHLLVQMTPGKEFGSWLETVVTTLGGDGSALAQLAATCRSAGVRRVVIIPCGLLGVLPLHAALIPGASPDAALAPLSDTARISYAPSAQVWIASVERARAQAPARPEALLIGNPLPLPAGWASLRGAEREARRISELCQEEAHGETQTFIGEEATRAAVLEGLQSHAARLTHVHCACHGHADALDPERSALVLAGGAELRVRDLLDPEQGIRFEHLRLSTLSACQTGIPGVTLPDEVVGLPASWLQAGAAAVLASLWPVSDAATVALMTRFYELHLLDGLDPVDALWLAQRWLRGLPSWREDYAAAGATRALAEPEAVEAVRGLAQTRGLELMDEDETDERARGATSDSGSPRPSWQQARIWAAFAVYGA